MCQPKEALKQSCFFDFTFYNNFHLLSPPGLILIIVRETKTDSRLVILITATALCVRDEYFR